MELPSPRIHNDLISHKGRGRRGHPPDDPSMQGPPKDLFEAARSGYLTLVRNKVENIIKTVKLAVETLTVGVALFPPVGTMGMNTAPASNTCNA